MSLRKDTDPELGLVSHPAGRREPGARTPSPTTGPVTPATGRRLARAPRVATPSLAPSAAASAATRPASLAAGAASRRSGAIGVATPASPSVAAMPAARSARADRLAPHRLAVPVGVDPTRGHVAVAERSAARDEPVEGQRGLDAADLRLVERPPQGVDRGVAVLAVDHDLRDEVVVVRRDESPAAIAVSTLTPGPDGITHRPTRPGVGANARDGSSAAIRTSIACPVGVAARPPAATTSSPSGAPPATRSCSRTRSTPATSSVTPCSTCSRVLTSRNQNAPSGSSRNSHVAALRSPAATPSRIAIAWRSRRWSVGQARRGRLLDELLVPALQRAVALAQRDDVAVVRRRSAGPRRGARAAISRSR